MQIYAEIRGTYDREVAPNLPMYPQSLKKNQLKIIRFMVKTLTCGRLLGQPP